MLEIDQSSDINQQTKDTVPLRYPHFEVYLDPTDLVIRITSTDPFGVNRHYIPLRILPDPVDDTDDEFDIFVKDYSLKDKKEPLSYNQELPGLEANHKYIKRLRVPGKIMLAVHREIENK